MQKHPLPLSVCLITYNEETSIQSCLNSVQAFAQEIILVDTHSTDRTKDLAREMGAHVYDHAWNDNFAEARNVSIEKATQPYILIIDADEVLSEDSLTGLTNYIALAQHKLAGRVAIINLQEDQSVMFKIPRIFPNTPEFYFEGRVHEQLIQQNTPLHTIETDIKLIHSGYRQDIVQAKNKLERNFHLLTLELRHNPDDAYLHYQIGKTCFSQKNDEMAGYHFQKAIDLINLQDISAPYLPVLLVTYGYTLLNRSQWDLLYILLQKSIDIFPDYTDLYFLYGVALIHEQNPLRVDAIPKCFRHCLELGEPDPAQYETVQGVGSYKAHYNLGLFYEMFNQPAQALSHYQAAASQYPLAAERLSQLS